MNNKYVYALPNETMYHQVHNPTSAQEMMCMPGFLPVNFFGNIDVIKTRPGHVGDIAYNSGSSDIPGIPRTIIGDDTISVVVKVGASEYEIIDTPNDLLLDM